MIRLLLIFLAISCGSIPVQEIPREQLSSLDARRELYLSTQPFGWQAYGNMGDGLLFACLSAVAHDREFDVESARNSNGQWFRNPAMVEQRLEKGSTISRDMFIGLFVYVLHFGRLDLAEQIWEYGSARSWKMGEDTRKFDTRVYLSPSTIALLARIIHHLGGADHPQRHLPLVYSTAPGYQSHLSLLTMQMVGKMEQGLGLYELNSLRSILRHMHGNPLAQAVYHRYSDGNQSIAIRILDSLWPEHRSPNTETDWCEEWRTQRSDGDSGFQACPRESYREHSGADFLYVIATIRGEI